MNQQTEWNQPIPADLPGPTAAPFMLAFAVTMMFAGVVTSWLMSLGGIALLIVALTIWIRALCNEWQRSK